MPSPRAVLADITDFKLDPNVPHEHAHIRASGRLHVKPAVSDAKPVVEANEASKPVVVETTKSADKPAETKEQPVKKPVDKADKDKKAQVAPVVTEKPKQIETVETPKAEPSKLEIKPVEQVVEPVEVASVVEMPAKAGVVQMIPIVVPEPSKEEPKKEDVKDESIATLVVTTSPVVSSSSSS